MEKYQELTNAHLREKPLPKFEIGDSIDVHVQIKEGDKERIQLFSGTVIAMRGTGLGASFTVRRIVQGEGVERTFPSNSPKVADITIKTKAVVRRAKLYYLRDRTGKGTRLRERLGVRPVKGKGKGKATS